MNSRSPNGVDQQALVAKVVHITTVHAPDDVRIFHKQAATLAAHGYEVTLLCARASTVSIQKGVRILPLPSAPGRMRRMTRTVFAAYRRALDLDADLYHFHDPELLPVGIALKFAGKRVVYDIHENASKDVYDKAYLPAWSKPFVSRAVSLIERWGCRYFDALVVATRGIETAHRGPRTVLVRNLPILNELTAPASVPFRHRPPNAVYIGGLGRFNGVTQMIQAMAHLEPDSEIRLLLGGRFSSVDDEKASRALGGASRVDFLGWVGRDRLPECFMGARCGFVLYQPTPNAVDAEPNKFFEVLAAGLPLVASDVPHWRAFIEEHGCGVVVDPTDPLAISRALREVVDKPDWAEDMGKRGRMAVEAQFNWEAESELLLGLYHKILAKDRTL